MGRELFRVPISFDWPLNKVWGGYLNPFGYQSIDCDACEGSGLAPEAKRIRDQWYGHAHFDPVAYGAVPLTVDHPSIQAVAQRNVERSPEYYVRRAESIGSAVAREAGRLFMLWRGQWSHQLIQADVDALVADDRLYDFTRTPRTEEQREAVRRKLADGGNSWLPESNGYTPTAEEVNAWSMLGMGHDAINNWVCVKARCAREGVPTECPKCSGEGSLWPSPEIKKQCEEWERTDPPEGPGFQLWTTTNEGAPITPVFVTIEALCEYAAEHATTFGDSRATAEQWREMLDADFVRHEDEHGNVFM